MWTFFSIFAIVFQCGRLDPYIYEPSRCADGVLWYPIAGINAVTDAALAFSFHPVIMKLAAKTRTKVEIMVLLGMRVS